jgi:hypothetical protein
MAELRNGGVIPFDVWSTVGDTEAVCGGDSGGMVVQDGKLVGVTSMVDADNPFIAYGTTFFTVPSSIAAQLIGE